MRGGGLAYQIGQKQHYLLLEGLSINDVTFWGRVGVSQKVIKSGEGGYSGILDALSPGGQR